MPGRTTVANARYSLRAFAADVCVDHSTLSQFLRDRRPLTERTIRLFGKRLKLSETVVDAFECALEYRVRTANSREGFFTMPMRGPPGSSRRNALFFPVDPAPFEA